MHVHVLPYPTDDYRAMGIMDTTDRIESNPHILGGKPVIKDTRVPVWIILQWLGQGWTHADILENYPRLTEEDIRACLRFAQKLSEQPIAA